MWPDPAGFCLPYSRYQNQTTMAVIVLIAIACVCMASVALEGGALYLLQAGWGGTCPWCPPASATYAINMIKKWCLLKILGIFSSIQDGCIPSLPPYRQISTQKQYYCFFPILDCLSRIHLDCIWLNDQQSLSLSYLIWATLSHW